MLKRFVSALVLTASLAACGGGDKQAAEGGETAAAAAPATQTPAGGEITPGPGGKVITIEMITDEKGNYFQPKDIEAHPGDVLRYTLKTGVHNVNFLPDSNAGKSNLPPASQMLQLPGQTHDILVNMAEGDYYFQCDPHAALGMVGKLEVEKKD